MDLLKAGKPVILETRRWDDGQGTSYPMRSKEDARDYRYFPEPDLPSLEISDAWIERIQKARPEMRKEKAARYQREFSLPAYDALLLTESPAMARLFEETVAVRGQPKAVSNWLMVEGMRLLKEQRMEPEQMRLSPEHLADLIAMVETKEINRAAAREVFEQMVLHQVEPRAYIEEKGLRTVWDENALLTALEQVFAANPQSVQDYLGGKERAAGFLVGQVMRAMKGKADPERVSHLVKERLHRYQ